MLSKLRHRLFTNSLSGDDLDQLVITSFLTVVSELRLEEVPDRISMHLRQRTQRRVFRLLRDERRLQDAELLIDPEGLLEASESRWPETLGNSDRSPQTPTDAASAVSFLVTHAQEVLDGECFELVTATAICGRQITEYLERAAPKLEQRQRSREYQRIKRRHSRAIARLRSLFFHFCCPHFGGDRLLHSGSETS